MERKTLRRICCVLLAMLLASSAWGQDGDLAAAARSSDAAADRGMFFNRAETIGEGKTSFSVYELYLAGFTHAWSDNAQLTVNTLVPIFEDTPLFLTGNAKFVLARTNRSVLSVQGELLYTRDSDTSSYFGAFGGALLFDYHLSRRLMVYGQFGLDTIFSSAESDDPEESAVDLSLEAGKAGLSRIVGGASFGISDSFKLNAEAIVPIIWADGEFDVRPDYTVLFYGVRFAGRDLSADFGFFNAAEGGPAIPWLSFSARF